jgi:hypothetical protein
MQPPHSLLHLPARPSNSSIIAAAFPFSVGAWLWLCTLSSKFLETHNGLRIYLHLSVLTTTYMSPFMVSHSELKENFDALGSVGQKCMPYHIWEIFLLFLFRSLRISFIWKITDGQRAIATGVHSHWLATDDNDNCALHNKQQPRSIPDTFPHTFASRLYSFDFNQLVFRGKCDIYILMLKSCAQFWTFCAACSDLSLYTLFFSLVGGNKSASRSSYRLVTRS